MWEWVEELFPSFPSHYTNVTKARRICVKTVRGLGLVRKKHFGHEHCRGYLPIERKAVGGRIHSMILNVLSIGIHLRLTVVFKEKTTDSFLELHVVRPAMGFCTKNYYIDGFRCTSSLSPMPRLPIRGVV